MQSKKMKDKSNGREIKRSKAWKRTYNIEGHEPKFKIRCFRCKMEDGLDMPMALRHSKITVAGEASRTVGMNTMSYKCPACDWFISFMVMDDMEYMKDILENKRGGNKFLVPTVDDWSEESDLIKEKLEALGYF